MDYLLKPISFNRFLKGINKFQKLSGQHLLKDLPKPKKLVNDHLYVNANKKFIKVKFDEVLYIESIKDCVRIHTIKENITTKDKISEFEITGIQVNNLMRFTIQNFYFKIFI